MQPACHARGLSEALARPRCGREPRGPVGPTRGCWPASLAYQTWPAFGV